MPRSNNERYRAKAFSWVIAAGAFALALVFGVYELRGKLFMNELLARNDAERTLNLLLSVARASREQWISKAEDRIDFRTPIRPNDIAGEARDLVVALSSHAVLGDRVRGLGAYDESGNAVFRFGTAPDRRPAPPEIERDQEGSPPRWYSINRSARSIRIIHPFPVVRFRTVAPIGKEMDNARFSDAVLFYDLSEERLFSRNGWAWSAFIAWLIASATAILIIRRTAVRNVLYRQELRDQRELVALGAAARTLAHEIKNPLSAIKLQAELIGRRSPGVADNELRGIGEEVARIRLLVDRIGDFLREPAGDPTEITLGAFAAESLARAGNDGTPIPIRVEGTDPIVRADRDRLRSVLENLVRNAYESGGPAEEVMLTVRTEGAKAVVEVLDRGTGLDAAGADRAFDPFFTTKTRGFGLGLALSRRFVEAANGSLGLASRDGGGTTARIILPRSAP